MVTLPMLVNALTTHILSIHSDQGSFHQSGQTGPRHVCLNSNEYRGIYLVDGSPATDNHLIYVGDSDSIRRLLISDCLEKGCVLFSAGDSEELRNAPRHSTTLIITDLSLTSLYNHLFRIFIQAEDWQKLLTASSHKGLKPILQAAADQLGLSVMLLSPNLQPVIKSIRNGEEALMSLNLQRNDNLPSANLKLLVEQAEADDSYSAILTPRKEGYIHALIPIHQECTILGYLFACSNGKASVLNNMLYVLARVMANQMINDDHLPTDADSFQALASQFLSDQAEDFDKLEARLNRLPKRPRQFMRSIIIRLLDEDGVPSPVYPQTLRQLYHELRSFFPLDNMALLNECVYVMTSYDKPDASVTIDKNEAFDSLLEKYGAFSIISNPSQRLRGVRVLFRQCFQILPVAVAVQMPDESPKRCFRFERYSPYYIIHLCEKSARQEMGVNDILFLCHPAILTLTRYDRAFNNNLRDTLFVYLMNDRSISETSRKLFMHRNTTIYKLNKIEELIHDNLDNPYTRHQLILSCMIIRYVEQYQHSTVHLPPLDSGLLRK